MGFRFACLHLTLTNSKGQGQGHAHMDTVTILDKLIDRIQLLFPSNGKPCVSFRLGYLHLTLANFNGQGQHHAYFTSEYLENGYRQENIIIAVKQDVMYCLTIVIFQLTLKNSEGKIDGHAQYELKFLGNVKGRATFTIATKYVIIYGLSFGISLFGISPNLNVKVMHILTVTILEMLIDVIKLLFPSKSKSCMSFPQGYIRMELAHFKGQGQNDTYFTSEYLENGDRQ